MKNKIKGIVIIGIASILFNGCAGDLPKSYENAKWKNITLTDIATKGWGDSVKLGNKKYLFQMWKNDKYLRKYCEVHNGTYNYYFTDNTKYQFYNKRLDSMEETKEGSIKSDKFIKEQFAKIDKSKYKYGKIRISATETGICKINNKVAFITFAKKRESNVDSKRAYYQILDFSDEIKKEYKKLFLDN